jgi:hypothetical protein
MSTQAQFSVTIWVNNRKVKTINEVRDNGNFRALRRYLSRLYPICKVNLYYQGIFQRQINYNSKYDLF